MYSILRCASTWGVERGWKLRDLVTHIRDLGDPFFFHFIDSYYRVHGYVGALYRFKLGLQAFLGRIHHDRGSFAKNQILYDDKTVEFGLIDLMGKDLVDLALIYENHLVCVLGCHSYV